MNAPQTCIVLAGGLGTRLGSILNGLPKCLAPVGKRSFLDIQLEFLSAGGVDRFVLSLGHGADAVLARVPALRSRHAIETVVEPERLGTGGGILFAMSEAGLEECLVINGDTFLDAPLSPLLTPLDLAHGELLRLATVEVPDRSRFGGLESEGGRVRRFLEKGVAAPGPINAGLYRVSRRAFGNREPGAVLSFEQDVVPALVAASSVTAVPTGGTFIDIGVPDDYRRFCLRREDA